MVHTNFIGNWIKKKQLVNTEDNLVDYWTPLIAFSLSNKSHELLFSPGLSHGEDISLRNFEWWRVSIRVCVVFKEHGVLCINLRKEGDNIH